MKRKTLELKMLSLRHRALKLHLKLYSVNFHVANLYTALEFKCVCDNKRELRYSAKWMHDSSCRQYKVLTGLPVHSQTVMHFA